MYGRPFAQSSLQEAWAPPDSGDLQSNKSRFDEEPPFGPPQLSTNKNGGGVNFHNYRPPDQTVINGRVVTLKVVKQPEDEHRARYMSEGSRGAIKGKHGKGHCTIQLVGFNRPTRVEIYAATEVDPMSPHPLYRVIPVLGKGGASQTTPCEELRNAEGIPCVSVLLRPELKMTAVLDCIGILKICSHESKNLLSKSTRNTVVQLVFRAVIAEMPGHFITIQTLSSLINCTQQLGQPEVQKVSAVSDSVRGGTELYILGRNFGKNIRVVFREYDSEGNLVWIADGTLDKKYSHTCHLVCTVPTYRTLALRNPVEVTMTLECGKKSGHPQSFTYHPDNPPSVISSGVNRQNSLPEKWRPVENEAASSWNPISFPTPVAEFFHPSPSSTLQLLEPVSESYTEDNFQTPPPAKKSFHQY